MEVNSLEQATIHFENVSQNEVFAYSLILVRGLISVSADSESFLFVHQFRNEVNQCEWKARVRYGRFAIILQLEEGENEFQFSINENECCRHTFIYRPATTKHVVMPMYIQCETNTENIKDDTASSSMDVLNRITLGCKLIQTMIAETLHQSGFGRKTFALESNDPNGNQCTVVFNSRLRWEEASKMDSVELWEHLGREIMTSEYSCKNRKFLAFLSTNMRCKNEYSQYLAIGGGGLALCDAKYIQTWPAVLDDFNSSLNSNTPLIEHNFSASLGAVCHELCHTFDLGHTVNGIMGKDFNRVCSLFVATENIYGARKELVTVNCTRNDSLVICEGPMRRQLNINFSIADTLNANMICDAGEQRREPSGKRVNLNETLKNNGFWFRGCATLLAYHRWINHRNNMTGNETPLHYDPIRCIVTSVHGIMVIQLRNSDGYIMKYWEFSEQRKKKLFLVPICYVRSSATIIIEDSVGNLLKRDIESIL